MTDRDFWIAVRAALLLFISAIEQRWQLGKHAPPKVEALKDSTHVTVTGV